MTKESHWSMVPLLKHMIFIHSTIQYTAVKFSEGSFYRIEPSDIIWIGCNCTKYYNISVYQFCQDSVNSISTYKENEDRTWWI
jgi:hypothetical protein